MAPGSSIISIGCPAKAGWSMSIRVSIMPITGTVPQASPAISVQPIICGAKHWGAVQAGSNPSV